MKRSSIIIPFILCMISSCTSKLEVDPVTHADEAVVETKAATGQKYSVASDEAEYFAKVYSPEKEVKSVKPYGKSESPALYVINYNDGWIMIAGDMRVEPVLAYSEKGSFNATDCENENLIAWLNSNAEGIEALAGSDYMPENDEIIKMWRKVKNILGKDTPNTAVQKTKSYTETFWHKHYTGMVIHKSNISSTGHLMSTQWGQESPWNASFPMYEGTNTRVKTGCVAVAIAQVLYYNHFRNNRPNALYHSVTTYPYVGVGFSAQWTKTSYTSNSPRWSSMAQDKYDYGTSYVSDLMADVADRVGMRFMGIDDGSGALLTANSFWSFGLSASSGSYNLNIVEANINSSRPVLISSNGHAWAIDGVVKYDAIFEYTYEWRLVNFEINEREDVIDDSENFYYTFDEASQLDPVPYVGMVEHEYTSLVRNVTRLLMNWGWDGLGDSAEYLWNGDDWDGYYNNYSNTMVYNIY